MHAARHKARQAIADVRKAGESMGIFREKSLEELDNPDKLDSFIEVTSARVWIALLAAVFALIALVCVAVSLFGASLFDGLG